MTSKQSTESRNPYPHNNNRMPNKEQSIKKLMTIPSVGKSITNKFYNIGIRKISDLKNKDPEEIYIKCCAI